jgi:hypothetical protein
VSDLSPHDRWPFFDSASDAGAVTSELERLGLGDGLPLGVPTLGRLEAMLALSATSPDDDARNVLMPPLMGELDRRSVAYQCLLAGCDPGALDVVYAILCASLEPSFNLLGLLTTTGTPAVAALVDGPLTSKLGMNSASNCLGPGNVANATIGRAVALGFRNIAGALPGSVDMATMGQPGKYTFCFAATDTPQWPTARNDNQTIATVMGVSGTLEVLPDEQGDTPAHWLRPVALAAAGGIAASSGGRARAGAIPGLLIPPEIVARVKSRGWDKFRVRGFLVEAVDTALSRLVGGELQPDAPACDDFLIVETGGPGVKMTCLLPWAGGSVPARRVLSH